MQYASSCQELREQTAVFTAAVAAATSTPTKTAGGGGGNGGGSFISLAEHRALVARRLEAQREESAKGLEELRSDLKLRLVGGWKLTVLTVEGASALLSDELCGKSVRGYPASPFPSQVCRAGAGAEAVHREAGGAGKRGCEGSQRRGGRGAGQAAVSTGVAPPGVDPIQSMVWI